MENNILAKLLENTYTLSGLKKKIKALKSALQEEYFGKGDTDTLNIQQEEKEWLKGLPHDFLIQFKKEDFNEIFKLLESRVDSLSPLTMYLAFEPKKEQLDEIGEYIRKNFSKDILADIKIDPSLIGGCALIWKGVYKDYSLKSRIQSKKEEILSSFGKFLKS